jgi:DNA adenine methylase
MVNQLKVKPFFTYAGGKQRMLDLISENIPARFGSYFEPFLGGGAVALEVMSRNEEATFRLSDYNDELVLTWIAVRDEPDLVLEALREHTQRHSKEYFVSVRNWDRFGLLPFKSSPERAARFIYICNSSFGGGYNFSTSGVCNSGYGREWVTFNEANFLAVSRLLRERNVQISHRSFELIEPEVQAGDFIYLDPPYATDADDDREVRDEYVKSMDTGSLQMVLKDLVDRLTDRGASILVSNLSTRTTRELFADWDAVSKVILHTGGEAKNIAVEMLWGNSPLVRSLPVAR